MGKRRQRSSSKNFTIQSGYIIEKLQIYDEMLKICQRNVDDDDGDYKFLSPSNRSIYDDARSTKTRRMLSKMNIIESSPHCNKFSTFRPKKYNKTHANLLRLSSYVVEKEEPEAIVIWHGSLSSPRKFTRKFSIAGYDTLKLSSKTFYFALPENSSMNDEIIHHMDDDIDGKQITTPNVKKSRAFIMNQFLSKCTYKSCPICLERMIIGQRLVKLPCKHYFHIKCYDAALKNQQICSFCQNPFDDKRVTFGRCEIL